MSDTIPANSSLPFDASAQSHEEPRVSANVLVRESVPSNKTDARRARGFLEFELSQSPTMLVEEEFGGEVRLATLAFDDGDPTSGKLHPVLDSSTSAAGTHPVLVAPPGVEIRVNGLPTPIIAPLELGDQLSLVPGSIFHVSRRQEAGVVATPEAFVGETCPLCLIAFTAEARVLLCLTCGSPRHLEGEEVEEEADRLACAALGPCPVCESPVAERSGSLAFVPDGFNDPEENSC
jgi:hypothetical protein